MPDAAAPVKGTRPEGAQTEADAARKVREMFTQIAPRYDFLNHLLSLQIDRLWRARAAAHLGRICDRGFPLVLDLCCGTGDLGIGLAVRSTARVIGADFVLPMLTRAKKKGATLRGKNLVQLRRPKFVGADALQLPFADQSFDLVMTAFGFRNLANYEAGLREIQRILKPGGTIAILEFTEPPDDFVGNVFRWYYRNILPRIGGLISGDSNAYTYLPKSVSRFFRPPELAVLIESVGYNSVHFRTWTLGTVALHMATKQIDGPRKD